MTKRITSILILILMLIAGTCVADVRPEQKEESKLDESDFLVSCTYRLMVSSPYPESEEEEVIEEQEVIEECSYFKSIPFSREMQLEMKQVCDEVGIEYQLVLALFKVETRCQNLIGDSGDSQGLGQIQMRWWSELLTENGITDLMDEIQNTKATALILKELIDKYGDIEMALNCYNTGRPDNYNGYSFKVFNEYWILEEEKNNE